MILQEVRSEKIPRILEKASRRIKNSKTTLQNLLIPVSFTIPILILYYVDPNSFNLLWKGRAFYLLFLWLLALEIIMSSEQFTDEKLVTRNPVRAIILIAVTAISVGYATLANLPNFSKTIIEFGKMVGIPQVTFTPPLSTGMISWLQEWSWPLSLEYLTLVSCFITQIWLAYKTRGLKIFSISLFFLSAIGAIYTLDTFYPYGSGPTAPFQALVPTTAFLAAKILNMWGYQTLFLGKSYGMPVLYAFKPSTGSKAYTIGWPCAGIEGFFIYTFVILLLLKKTRVYVPSFVYEAMSIIRDKIRLVNSRELPKWCETINRKSLVLLGSEKFVIFLASAAYFIVGAIGTYIVNAFRIATIFVIGITQGDRAASMFHDIYGGLYTAAWIITYTMVLMFLFHKKRGNP